MKFLRSEGAYHFPENPVVAIASPLKALMDVDQVTILGLTAAVVGESPETDSLVMKGLWSLVYGSPCRSSGGFQKAARYFADVASSRERCHLGRGRSSHGFFLVISSQIVICRDLVEACRRKMLLRAFGSSPTCSKVDHKCCDVCTKTCSCGITVHPTIHPVKSDSSPKRHLVLPMEKSICSSS